MCSSVSLSTPLPVSGLSALYTDASLAYLPTQPLNLLLLEPEHCSLTTAPRRLHWPRKQPGRESARGGGAPRVVRKAPWRKQPLARKPGLWSRPTRVRKQVARAGPHERMPIHLTHRPSHLSQARASWDRRLVPPAAGQPGGLPPESLGEARLRTHLWLPF